MAECFICLVSGAKAELLDGVSNEGIMKVCRKCADSENIPIIKRHEGYNRGVVERPQSVHERLSRIAGVEVEKSEPEKRELKKQETTLKEIVDRNYEERAETKGIKSKGKAEELVDNFHWILMRVRRLKKITPEEVASDINESASAIKMLEKGVLSDNYIDLVKKLEVYYNVKLIKDEFREKVKTPITVVNDAELLGKPEDIFTEDKSRALTISDLRSLRKKSEMDLFDSDKEPLSQRESLTRGVEEVFEPDYMINDHISEDSKATLPTDDEPEFVEKHEEIIDEMEIKEEDEESFPPSPPLNEYTSKEEDISGEEISSKRIKEEMKKDKEEKSEKENDNQLSNEEIDKILYGGR